VTITVKRARQSRSVSFGDSFNFDEDVGGTAAPPTVSWRTTRMRHGTTLTAINATQPTHGTLVMNSDGSFTYTPSANYFGPDSSPIRPATARQQHRHVVSITVHPVNDSPVGVADSYRVVPNTQLTVTAANGVLKNDTDIDSTNLTASLKFTTTHGNVEFGADGSFTYMPNNGFTGTDSFTYASSWSKLASC